MKINLNLTPEVLNTIKQSFSPAKKTIRKIRPCRIKFMGEFITLESGKNLWRRKGDAKSAMLNHLNSSFSLKVLMVKNGIIPCKDDNHIRYVLHDINIEKLKEDLENAGYIEYVEVDS